MNKNEINKADSSKNKGEGQEKTKVLGSNQQQASVLIQTDKEDAVNLLASYQKDLMNILANQGYSLRQFKVQQKTMNIQSMVLPTIDSDQLTKVNIVQ